MLASCHAADGPSPEPQFIAATTAFRRFAAGPAALPALVWGRLRQVRRTGLDERTARCREVSAIQRGSKG